MKSRWVKYNVKLSRYIEIYTKETITYITYISFGGVC